MDLLTLVKEEVVGAAQLISGVKTVGIEVAALSLSKTTIAIGTRQSVPFKEEKVSPSYFKDRFQIFLTIADRWRRTRLGVFWFNETLERKGTEFRKPGQLDTAGLSSLSNVKLSVSIKF